MAERHKLRVKDERISELEEENRKLKLQLSKQKRINRELRTKKVTLWMGLHHLRRQLTQGLKAQLYRGDRTFSQNFTSSVRVVGRMENTILETLSYNRENLRV
jgi:hypothetical protein